MDALVKLVMEKTGLPKAQAKSATETVIGFLKEKLPAPIAGQIDTLLASDESLDQVENLLDQGMDAIGGLLKKK